MVGVVLQGKWLVDSNIVTFFNHTKGMFFFEMTAAAYFLDGVKHGFIPPSRSRLAMIGHVMRYFFWIIPLLSNWAKESHFSKGGHLQNLPTRVLSHDSWDDPPDVCESSFDILSQTGSKTIS